MSNYLFLLIAFALNFVASGGKWNIPLAAWLAPIFVLRFYRNSQRPGLDFVLLWLATAIPLMVSWSGATFFPRLGEIGFFLAVALVCGLALFGVAPIGGVGDDRRAVALVAAAVVGWLAIALLAFPHGGYRGAGIIVEDDANLDLALRAVVFGAIGTAGQSTRMKLRSANSRSSSRCRARPQ